LQVLRSAAAAAAWRANAAGPVNHIGRNEGKTRLQFREAGQSASAMKVQGPSASAPLAGRSAARPAAGGFAPAGQADASAPAARAASTASVGSLEALLALQETLSPTERRRRAVRRGGRILDALDDLRIAVLDPEGLDGAALQRLAGAIREAREDSQDPGLEALLEQIEIRAAVELAKRRIPLAA
jgi:hypothetical protein